MIDHYDFEDCFKLFGFEEAMRFLLEQTKNEIRSGQNLDIVLVRFHSRVLKLKTLAATERRSGVVKKRSKRKKKE